jgi:ankyrin repeat protein
MNDLQTPLHIAAQRGHEKIVQLLLDRGADINSKDVTRILFSFFFILFVFIIFDYYDYLIFLLKNKKDSSADRLDSCTR